MKTSAGMIIKIQMKTKYPKILAFSIKLKELWIRKNFVAFIINLYIILKYIHLRLWNNIPAGNYMFKVNNTNARIRCEICSELTIKIPERRHIVNFKHISHLVLVFLLLTLSR